MRKMLSFLQFWKQQDHPYYTLSILMISLLLPLFFLHFLFKRLAAKTPKTLPPSPPKLPVLGNLLQLGSSAHCALQTLSHRYGPLMLLHIGSKPVLVASTADAAHEIMKTHDVIFSDRVRMRNVQKLLYNCKDVAAAPYGDYWRRVKSICVLHLLSNRRVESFRGIRQEETALLVEEIKQSAAAAAKEAVDLSEKFMLIANDVVCRVALGKKYRGGERGRRLKQLLREFVECGVFSVGEYIPWLSWVNVFTGLDAKVERVFKAFDSFLQEIVQEHIDRRNSERAIDDDDQKDFVDVLLDVQKDNAAGFPIEGDSIKAIILDMFSAGTDTTSTVLEWAMTELIRHPRVMKKLQDEVRGIKRPGLVKDDDLQKMQYLKAVMKETLRLHPPNPLLVPRQPTQDVKVRGYDIAAGTMTIISAWAIGRDPETWGENSNEFRPERFLNSSVDFRGQDFQLIPFGAGRRGCPGIAFAMATDELVLANLVREFDWTLPCGERGEDLDMAEAAGATLHRKNPLLAIATVHPWQD